MPERRPPALVGRYADLALLRGCVKEAREGRGTAVLVRGEAGIGKSRLLAEVAQEAGRLGMIAASGRAVQDAGAYRCLTDALLVLQREAVLPPPEALGAFAAPLAGLVPGWMSAQVHPTPADRSLLVSEGLLRLLREIGAKSGVVLLLDDLQWLDPDTAAALDRLLDAVPEMPTLLVLAARDDVPDSLLRFAGRLTEVVLARLTPQESAALVDACDRGLRMPVPLRDEVVDRAEGLPFLIRELVDGLIDGGGLRPAGDHWEARPGAALSVPASVAAAVRRRLTLLSPVHVRVVEAAALLGREVDWPVLTEVTGHTPAEVAEACGQALEAGLFVRGSAPFDPVRFRHALTRDAVLARLLPPQRNLLARRAAAVVERGADLVLAASLWEQADDLTRAASLLVRAGTDPAVALRTREALLRRAVALTPAGVDPVVALVEVLALAGQAEEAQQVGDPLLHSMSEDDPRRADLALTLARACHVAARPGDALSYLELAGDRPVVQAVAAHIAFARQDPGTARRLASSVVEADDPQVRCEALEITGRVARLEGRAEDAERAFAEALAVARRLRLGLWEVRALHELGTLDLLGPARSDRLEAARSAAVRSGQLGSAAVLDVQLAALHGLRMEHEASVAAARRAVELSEALRLPALAGAALMFVATAQGHAGAVAEMHQTLDDAEARLGPDPDKRAGVRFARGTPAMVSHDLASWRAHLEAGMALVRANPTASPSPMWGLHALLETVLVDGSVARDELRRSGATIQACNRGALDYADAVAAGRRGDDPTLLVAGAEAVMGPLLWRRHHMRLLVAPSALAHGWGEPLTWLREALDYFAERREAELARACREELRAAGVPVPRQGRGDSVVPAHLRRLGVTSREMDVLLLISRGLSNREAAHRLVLSTRTVETHVASLLAKTGVRARAQLAGQLAEPPCRGAVKSVGGED